MAGQTEQEVQEQARLLLKILLVTGVLFGKVDTTGGDIDYYFHSFANITFPDFPNQVD